MRTKFGVSAAVAAIVALVVLIFGSTVAAADHKGKRFLRVVGIEVQSEFVDVGTTDISLGDQFVFSEVLFRRGREVGQSGGVCTITEAVPPYDVVKFHCVATLSLRRGQITLQGLVEFQGEDDPGPFILAITGGTGAFRSVGGEAVVRIPRPGKTIYRLRLDFPKKDFDFKKKKPKPKW